jgi:hypothetical protein
MGFYIRKSVSVGPFRFNLSKSGIGVSTGIMGFRVGSGPEIPNCQPSDINFVEIESGTPAENG